MGATAVCAALAGCSGGGSSDATGSRGWSAAGLDVVSKAEIRDGIAAVTALRPDGALETDTFDLARGKRLWARPATMLGRTPDQGVQPPAMPGRFVATVEPEGRGVPEGRSRAEGHGEVEGHSGPEGRAEAEDRGAREGRAGAEGPSGAEGRGGADGRGGVLVARDARTGVLLWTRDVQGTFGPQACGPMLCLTERTGGKDTRFVALDPSADGRELWRMDGVAEVEWADASRVVVLRMTRHPSLEAHDLRGGGTLWTFPVEAAVGNGVDLSGGWAFGSLGASIVGYIGPDQGERGQAPASFGFFSVRLADGVLVWRRPRRLRVYPSASPAVGLITRSVTADGGDGGFERLDPATGRTSATVPADRAPRSAWSLSLSSDMTRIGFLTPDRPGRAVALDNAAPVQARGLRTWSFCAVRPSALKITGQPGFYPTAPLCGYDLGSGRRLADPGPPPGWYTGSTDGWRVWRDESGTLHALHDAKGTSPGMYGP
ncbi:hypothetical protein AB0L06_40040 [Spirillospora sp. NPDC052269]